MLTMETPDSNSVTDIMTEKLSKNDIAVGNRSNTMDKVGEMCSEHITHIMENLENIILRVFHHLPMKSLHTAARCATTRINTFQN